MFPVRDRQTRIAMGKRIAQARKTYEKPDGSTGLTADELAAMVGRTKWAIRTWEQGTSSPRRLEMFMLCDIFRKSVSWFVKGEDVPGEMPYQNLGEPARSVHLSMALQRALKALVEVVPSAANVATHSEAVEALLDDSALCTRLQVTDDERTQLPTCWHGQHGPRTTDDVLALLLLLRRFNATAIGAADTLGNRE